MPNPVYFSRLVSREVVEHTDDAVYAATPPLGAMILILSDAPAADNISKGHERQAQRRGMAHDMSRAYFYVPSTWTRFMRLPREGEETRVGDAGRLHLRLYGTSDAAKRWQQTPIAHLEGIGRARGSGHPSIFHYPSFGTQTLGHGDDYMSSRTRSELDWIGDQLSKKYNIKTPRLSYGEGMRESNIIVRVAEGGYVTEADPKHSELMME